MNNIPEIKLNNGVYVPQFGFGTWQLADLAECESCVDFAIQNGIYSIDTAMMYGNEVAVGRAIKRSGVPREKLYITSKLSNWERSYDMALRAFDNTMELLGLDYLDEYLIHWPGTEELYVPTWKAFERLYKEGRIRVIGVSNFFVPHMEKLMESAEITPAVNQLECHPYLYQTEIMEYCKEHGILVEAWSPLMSNGAPALKDPAVTGIAAELGKDAGQVILRWHIQSGRRVFPRSTKRERIISNSQIFDFELTPAQMAAIDALKVNNVRTGPHPDVFALKNER